MSFSRLYRLLKPALLCGALAAPGLASTMVSAAPPAGRPVGRWAGARPAFWRPWAGGAGRPPHPAAIRTGARARGGGGGWGHGPSLGQGPRRRPGGRGQGWAVGTHGLKPLTRTGSCIGAAEGGAVGFWLPDCGLESGGGRRGGNPGSRAAGRHCPSPALRAPGPLAVASQRSGLAPLATGPLSPGPGARWAQVQSETCGHGPRSRLLPGPSRAAAPLAGRATAPSPPKEEGSDMPSQEGAPPAEEASS